jgi:2-polyprenyl-3-methyl-5-hydroxy-6-metoxy-1,4-benzoquinol methylase
MQYDPIKKDLGNVFNKSAGRRKLFYKLLDILLLRTWHIKKAIRRWAKSAPEQAKILDAGSGFGQYSYYLSRKNPSWSILGVDVKTEQIEDCKAFFERIGKSNVQFQYADLTEFVHVDAYDLILSVDVMEHIEEDVKVFENFWKSLKPGGMLLISTPSDQGGSDVHHHDEAEPGNAQASFIDEHVRDGYNINEIQEKLQSAGFSKTEGHYSYGTPGKISWKLSMKYPISLLNVSKAFFIVLPVYYILTYWLSLILNVLDVKLKHKTGTGLVVKAWK